MELSSIHAEDESELNALFLENQDGPLQRVTLGSKHKTMTVQEVASSSFPRYPERAHAFKDFRKKIIGYLKAVVVPDELGRRKPPKITNNHEVCQSMFMLKSDCLTHIRSHHITL